MEQRYNKWKKNYCEFFDIRFIPYMSLVSTVGAIYNFCIGDIGSCLALGYVTAMLTCYWVKSYRSRLQDLASV